ncbi:uncharacterized protein BDR25DRAFT_116353 [Lindgomyces ingoldianus]|uniref:Uncharacterized protein n=1 Tax=Lindgomyces ingoldianus TaxID=673940 RepID=A0ACB6Q8D0_9PLEO|nr:uncharacterized protein BDR25DRAFT_116353 [Lindgomyces ingoldianus]KAF2463228.1 hypothetical protein BDR25DRAFT_116353 [Lindgomyces ingoldianus]
MGVRPGGCATPSLVCQGSQQHCTPNPRGSPSSTSRVYSRSQQPPPSPLPPPPPPSLPFQYTTPSSPSALSIRRPVLSANHSCHGLAAALPSSFLRRDAVLVHACPARQPEVQHLDLITSLAHRSRYLRPCLTSTIGRLPLQPAEDAVEIICTKSSVPSRRRLPPVSCSRRLLPPPTTFHPSCTPPQATPWGLEIRLTQQRFEQGSTHGSYPSAALQGPDIFVSPAAAPRKAHLVPYRPPSRVH